MSSSPSISLQPLHEDDREQFILDLQWAFRYGAQIEFGMRDDRTEEGSEVISRTTIERSIDGEHAETYRIVLDGRFVGGVVLSIALLREAQHPFLCQQLRIPYRRVLEQVSSWSRRARRGKRKLERGR